MLYVFHVDMGRMMKFDMNVALSSVQNLKDVIERVYGIPSTNIVLLVSGGEMLTTSSLVCSYSAGTDTNPIYMFSTVDVTPQPWPSIEPDVDLSEQVERCISLPATYQTVVARAQLAQQIHEIADEEEIICERLVHEQHLQQQGWSAVVANMEDLTDEFRQRFENFCLSFNRHLEKRHDYLQLLDNFNEDLSQLSRIPILPGLMQMAEKEFHGFDNLLDNDEVFNRSQQNTSNSVTMTSDGTQRLSTSESQDDDKRESTSPNKKLKMGTDEKIDGGNSGSGSGSGGGSSIKRTLTLFQWISAKKDNSNNALKMMANECKQGLSTFDENTYDKIKIEVLNIIQIAEKEDIKEIKGLGDRLCGLEEIMFKIKKCVQDQKELATAFQQNQNRANNLGDASILPDLCVSHQSQLLVMLNNQKQIREYRRRISKAKDELGVNLYKRLKYIVQIENSMSEFDSTLLFYHRCLRRAERHLNIIQQIHQTPSIYVSAVTEVFRRKLFSGGFIQWASNLACDFDAIHSEEIQRRQEFNANFEGHFLNTLFPGMNDMPPAFANENPLNFDAYLPNITKSDIETLSSFLPDLSNQLQVPDMGAVIDFFISRSGNRNSGGKSSTMEESNGKQPSSYPGQRPIDIHSHLKDGCESETDTEEFEKVGQITAVTISTSTSENIPKTNNTSTTTEPVQTHTVETLTEENLGSSRSEIERLKSIMRAMSQVSEECIQILRSNIETIKVEHETDANNLRNEIQNLSEQLIILQRQHESRENELIENLSIQHKTELCQLEELLLIKNHEIEALKIEQTTEKSSHKELIANVEANCDKYRDEYDKSQKEIEALFNELQLAEINKMRAINEIRDKLINEHKTEIESLRCRFKLMTSMERTPSDTSLEKIEKTDMIEIACHESILSQTREDFNLEKQKAILEAIEMERLKWQNNQKQMIEDRDKQIEVIREHDLVLFKENCQLKLRIESLTNEEESDRGWLKEKIDYLSRDKTRLEQELVMEKCKRVDMETSFAAMRSSVVNLPCRTRTPGGVNQRCIVIESCGEGDVVFVVWNIRHGQFMVVQDSPSLYFVHGDSLSILNLKIPDTNSENEIPMPFCTWGRVVHKEYCQARKDENRYKVPRGTKFYRIKLSPLSRSETKWQHKRERLESSSSNSSASRPFSGQNETDSGIGKSTISSRDTVDYPNQKERTLSVTSAAEDDDEPISLLNDRCRYISVSEEEEPRAVITEQPTSNKMDYTASSTAINLITTSTSYPSTTSSNLSTSVSFTTSTTSAATSNTPNLKTSSSCSLDKDIDDSDEYRSLEAKDDIEHIE